MAEEITFIIDGAEAANFTPFEGIGGSDPLPFDGSVQAVIRSARPRKLGADKAGYLVQCIVVDADAKGAQLLANVHATGKDRNGDPMSRQFWRALASGGVPVEKIQAQKEKKFTAVEGQKMLEGKTVNLAVRGQEYEGREGTEIVSWLTPETYKEHVASGAHRKPRTSTKQSGRGGSAAGNPNANGAKNPPAADATDLFATGGAASKPAAAATDLLL